MWRSFRAALVATAIVLPGTCIAQTNPNPALNTPDELSWQLFIEVNTSAPGLNNATFETWASDTDTFTANPQFPTVATPLALHAPIVPSLGLAALQESGTLLPAVPPIPGVGEETRRNQVAFDFIVNSNLHTKSGLKAAFGEMLSFPIDSIEVKANWLPADRIPRFTLNRVQLADVPTYFHVNTGSDGKSYALLSMHIISKLVPNWTWATFENTYNPGRCDILGCRDSFGAVSPVVQPNATQNQGYPDCDKTPALTALLKAASIDRAFVNYCLKGSQTDFTDNTGLDIRLGNSVTESGFVNQSSCMTCHGRAGFDANGDATSSAGFDTNGAPLGPIQPTWFWSFSGTPPIYQGMPGLTRIGTSADFVWSIPFCAIDDSVSPPAKSPCAGK
ncbi:MAG: hypothetical protein ACRED5_17955 [Propylenella sp.]